jgi:hypothetical protein
MNFRKTAASKSASLLEEIFDDQFVPQRQEHLACIEFYN